MSSDTGFRVLAGAVALAISGTAMANTTLSTSTSSGDVFVNVVDTSNNSSFLYDTGVTQASFNAGVTQSYNFASDPNYTAFVAAEGGTDIIDYSVFSATGAGLNTNTAYFTSSVSIPTQTAQSKGNIAGAVGAISQFFTLANSITSSTSNSVIVAGASSFFGTALTEGKIATDLLSTPNTPYGDNAVLGTSLAFYEDAVSGGSVTTYGAALAGTWDVVGGVATYTVASAVPLPTPMLLLLSGLGLMGVVTRRKKTA